MSNTILDLSSCINLLKSKVRKVSVVCKVYVVRKVSVVWKKCSRWVLGIIASDGSSDMHLIVLITLATNGSLWLFFHAGNVTIFTVVPSYASFLYNFIIISEVGWNLQTSARKKVRLVMPYHFGPKNPDLDLREKVSKKERYGFQI